MFIKNVNIFVLAPSLSILLLAGILGVLWIINKNQRFLLWLCSSYALVAIPLGFQSYATIEELNRYALPSGVLYLSSAWFLSMSFTERRQVPPQPQLASLIGILTLSALVYFSSIEPNIWARLQSFSFGAGLILLLPIKSAFKKEQPKDWINQILLYSYIFFAIFSIIRPVLIPFFGFKDIGDFSKSIYWLITAMSIVFFALLFTTLICSIAIREMLDQLRNERDHDSLTKILNRRSFLEAAQRRVKDKRLYPIALLAGDLDHFKYVNDTWGHGCGDQILQLVSSTLQRNIRANDLVARFGGEEFVLLLTRIDLSSAEQVAERIRFEINSDKSVLPEGSKITIRSISLE